MAQRSRQRAARRRRPARKRTAQRRPGLRQGLIWFGAGLGIGLAVLAPFYFLQGSGPEPGDRAAGASAPQDPGSRAAPGPEAGDGGSGAGDYRFYTLLPRMEVEVPSGPEPDKPGPPETGDGRGRPGSPPDSGALPRPSGEGEFLLQVASYRKPDAAEALKARLALKGFQARVVRADLGPKGTWYRVRLGPYPDRAAAESVRDRVERAGLEPMVMRP